MRPKDISNYRKGELAINKLLQTCEAKPADNGRRYTVAGASK